MRIQRYGREFAMLEIQANTCHSTTSTTTDIRGKEFTPRAIISLLDIAARTTRPVDEMQITMAIRIIIIIILIIIIVIERFGFSYM